MKLAEFRPKADIPPDPPNPSGKPVKLAGTGDPAPRGDVEPSAGSVAPLPGQITIDEAIQEVENESAKADEGEKSVTSVTPSGIEVLYSWAPRRLYRVRHPKYLAAAEWTECPSVTTVLGVLDKSGPLTWWAQGVAVDGVRELFARGEMDSIGLQQVATKEIVDLLVTHRLSVNHIKNSAADRGVNVHGALEDWFSNASIPTEKGIEQDWPENERGYIRGLTEFLLAIDRHNAVAEHAELMVGSLQHQYAGRFDLVLTLSKPVEVVTKIYPKRKPRIEEIPAGRYLLDLKTSKRVYETHYLQLEAYEAAAVECGYQPTDYRGVVHVTADGRYELALNKDWTFGDFLSVRACYQTMHERKIVQALRDELDAKDAA